MLSIRVHFRTFVCFFIMFHLLSQTMSFSASYSEENNVAELRDRAKKLEEKAKICRADMYRAEATMHVNRFMRELKEKKESRSYWKIRLEQLEEYPPGTYDQKIQEIKDKIDEFDKRINKLNDTIVFYHSEGWVNHELIGKTNDELLEAVKKKWGENNIRACDKLGNRAVEFEAKANEIEERRNQSLAEKQETNLINIKCDRLLGRIMEATTNPSSASGMEGLLEQAEFWKCPWYGSLIGKINEFINENNTSEEKQGTKDKHESTPEPPPSPPVDDEQVVEEPGESNEFFEEIGEDDSDPEPPPKPPVEEDVAEDDPNEYFEEVGESEAGSTADNSYDQSGNLCSSLLAQFNATYNIKEMEKILKKAQNCSWYGDGVAARQNQIDYYKEQNQRPQGAGFQGNCEPTKSGKIGDPDKIKIENDYCPDHRWIAVWVDKSQAMAHWCQTNRNGDYRQTHTCEKHCTCQGKRPTSYYEKTRIK